MASAWFDKTNEIVETLNPVAVYGITRTGITVTSTQTALQLLVCL